MTVGSSFLAEDIRVVCEICTCFYGKIHQRPVSSSSFRHFLASRAFFTYKLAKVGWWLCLCCVSEMQHFIVSQLIRKLTEEEEAKKLSDMRNGLINNQYV